MEQQKSEQSENQRRDESNSFEGYVFSRDSKSGIYKPISNAPNDKSSDYQISPILPLGVRVRRDWLEWVIAVCGWLISLITLVVVGTYTYYAYGQWQEMKKAAQAS